MKPLSIEELKNLIIGTWVYLTDKDGYLGRYVVKAEAPIEEDDKTFNFDSLSGSWTYNYRYYGTKWLAFKNKEQAECKCISYKFPCELGTTIYYIKKQCRDFFNDFDDNEDNWCKHYIQGNWYDEERCNLINKDCCSFNLEIYCEECKNKLKIEETNFCLELRDKIYGTDYYNKSLSLSHTYFLTKEDAEQKLKELRGKK